MNQILNKHLRSMVLHILGLVYWKSANPLPNLLGIIGIDCLLSSLRPSECHSFPDKCIFCFVKQYFGKFPRYDVRTSLSSD